VSFISGCPPPLILLGPGMSIVKLYVSYLGRAVLRHEVAEGRLSPVASGKVYELWVLSKLLKYLRGVTGSRGLVEEEADLYLVVRASGVRVYYNKPLRVPITTELLSGGRARPAELRPDFVVESGRGALVLDAKYRRGIGREDVERLITYVVEFARPVGGVLYGSLLTLEYVEARRAFRDSSLGVRIEVEVNVLDPRQGGDEVLNAVGRVLGRLGT